MEINLLELLRNKMFSVRPEPVEGHERRFDRFSANGVEFE